MRVPDFKVYKDKNLKCPHCGAEFEADDEEYIDYDLEGWFEYCHTCECGKQIPYFEVMEFSHYEVYE